MTRRTAILLLGVAAAPIGAQTIVAAPPYRSNIDGFIITEGDIADRAYEPLGPIKVSWGPATALDHEPTRESVNIRLTAAARKMGADAVVRVRYTARSASVMSWGGMQADGIAIQYFQPTGPRPF